jgi:hypothetical protein
MSRPFIQISRRMTEGQRNENDKQTNMNIHYQLVLNNLVNEPKEEAEGIYKRERSSYRNQKQ